MRLKRIFAVRFIHSEAETDTPVNKSLMRIGLGINAADGSLFTADEDGNTVPLSGIVDLELDKYVGNNRRLEDRPSRFTDINNGILTGLTDTINHLYFHTLAYVPDEDVRQLGSLAIKARTEMRLEVPPVQTGTNVVTVHYINRNTFSPEQIDYEYQVREGLTDLSELRIRIRSASGLGKLQAVDYERLEDPTYDPTGNIFIPETTGSWVIELVHDVGTGSHAYEDGELVGFINVGVVAND